MTAANHRKVMQLFDLVLIANSILPEQDRLTFSYSKYELFCTIMQNAEPTGDIKLFWWVYYEPAQIPAKEPPEKTHEYMTLDQAIERVREMIICR